MATLEMEALGERSERVESLLAKFKSTYGVTAMGIIRVPGRVNLIGEHIDYCGYAVHPMAIEQDILVAVARRDQPGLHLANMEDKYEAKELPSIKTVIIPEGATPWWAYFLCGLKGAAEDIPKAIHQGISDKLGEEAKEVGLCCLIQGTIPPSAGLSSSSALVVSAALCSLWAQQRLDLGREELANLCARAERFIGTQGGGMDQAIEILAVKGAAKLIEFGPLRTYNVQLPSGAAFVVANSLEEKNKAASNDYNTRVVECRLAAMLLAKQLLPEGDWREAGRLKDVQEKVGVEVGQMVERVEAVLHQKDYTREEVLSVLGETESWLQTKVLTPNTQDLNTFRLHQRAKHVYSEAARVYQFRDVCSVGGPKALETLGQMMLASHASCRDQYQCSSEGLDRLVNLAVENGALGARLTGAGWGGCIVALVDEEKADSFVAALKKGYYSGMNLTQEDLSRAVFVTRPGAGAKLWTVSDQL